MDHLLDEGLRLGVAQLGLGLTLELRLAQLHRDDRGQTLADVLAGEVVVLLAQQLLVPRVPVDQRGHRRTEALLVGTALMRVDRVREGVDALAVLRVPLHGDLGREESLLVLGLDVDHRIMDDVALARVQVLHEVDDAALVVVRDRARLLLLGDLGHLGDIRARRRLRRLTLVGELDRQTLVEERHLLEAARQGLEGVLGRLEDVPVDPEGDGRAGLFGGLVTGQRRRRHTELVVLGPAVAVPPDLDRDPRRQRVDHGDTDTVQTAGDGIAAAAELAAGVQHRQYDLDGRLALRRHDVDRDAPAVVDHPDRAVGEDRDIDRVGVAGQRLVDRVVDDLLHQVVQASLTGRADVHAGPLADRVQALQDGDRAGVVRGCHLVRGGSGAALTGGGRNVLVGVAGIGHEAPFLAQHRPFSGQAGAAASFGLYRRIPQGRGIVHQSTGSADPNGGLPVPESACAALNERLTTPHIREGASRGSHGR
ncbi:hypothetical protein EES39_11520 [Streptomyces sp. ADI92-24]|nr:hypothetical protein EES39_11520 [Streptomyces sp. ADI92-24]